MKNKISSLLALFLFLTLFFPTFLSAQVPAYVPTNGLVGYWPFNGNANDESGNGNHGNIQNGLLFTPDRFNSINSALDFDGIDDQLYINHSPSISPDQFVSVSAWVYPRAYEDGKYIVSKGSHVNLYTRSYGLFAAKSNQKAQFVICNGNIEIGVESITNIPLNSWTLVTGTYDGNNISIYINGIFESQISLTGNINQVTEPLTFGCHKFYAYSDYWFNGKIDDIEIYNRALTQEEITALYNGTTNTSITGCTNNTACNYNATATQDDGSCTFPAQTYLNCAGTCINDADNDGTCDELETPTLPSYLPSNGLVGYWPFNGNANDESGNGNHGTVNNNQNGAITFDTDRFNVNSSCVNFISNPSWNTNGPFIEISNNNSLMLNNSYSIVMWVKVSSTCQTGELLNKGNDDIGFFSRIQYPLAGVAFGSAGGYIDYSIPINTSEWMMLSFSRDGNNNMGELHINGTLVFSSFINSPISNSDNIAFGGMPGGGTNGSYYPFQGLMDDIAIYNRALTQEEITALYNGTTNTSIAGCTNSTACNYNASATQDDGSCTYPTQTYLNCAGTCINDADNDGTCDELETPTLPSYLPSNGLVGYWPFNGNANDESGNGNHGTVNGATLTTDRNGNANSAYSFENNSSIITSTNNFPFGNESRTICLNVFSSNFSQLNKMIAGYGNDNPLQMFSIIMYNSCCIGQPAFWARDHDIPYQIALANNNWHQLCVTYSNNEIRTYYNSELNQIVDYSSIPLSTPNSLNFHVGNFNENVQGFFGIIDDIAIYNRALTQEEITALYNGTTAISGCTNSTACNYNASATQDDGSCTYPAQTYLNCAGTCINDADNDGTCDELENPTLPSYLPSNGLVGYWPFNGNANDESGNGNHGTVNGATLTTDRNGNANSAYSFNSSSQNFIQTPELSLSGSVSFSGWYKMSSFVIPTNDVYFLSNQHPSETIYQSNIAFGFRSYQGEYGHSTYTGTPLVGYYGTNTLPTIDNWHHIVCVFENGDYLKMYLDDVLIYTNNTVVSNSGLPSKPLLFGSAGTLNWFYSGLLDDIAIYNRALSQEEITALYNGTTTGGGAGNGGTSGTPSPSVPQGIPYQAMIRDNSGAALVNTPVTVRFSLRQDAIDGTVEYQETHNLTTNAFGLVNTHFGTGSATQGTFANINWSNTTKFIQVEANSGGGFVEMGTQQMMSVPFALKANDANKATKIQNAGLPVYANNAAALAGGLVAGDMYRTAAGILMIVY